MSKPSTTLDIETVQKPGLITTERVSQGKYQSIQLYLGISDSGLLAAGKIRFFLTMEDALNFASDLRRLADAIDTGVELTGE